jgi:cell wall-associated NlpC family hydrolase
MPDLKSLVAKARTLSNEINSLDEQYNGLRIQLNQARAEVKVAQRTYAEDIVRLSAGKLSIGQLAAQSYMNIGLSTSLELLTSGNAQNLISRSSIMQQLQHQNGARIGQMAAAVAAAQRAKATFRKTGDFPNIEIPTANSIGAQALRAALTRRGDPYVWGAAGPSAFDCSGLVLWAYAQVGIGLPHFTGEQWNMGVHVARADLQPGDLVFFYPDIGHVGLYIGNGLMVDAPNFGEVVQVEPVMWDVYVGAVRIVG